VARALSIVDAVVTQPDGSVLDNVVVTTKRMTFLARKGRGRTAQTVVLEENVSAVRYISQQRWEVDTAHGTYQVFDRGCGCS
jgi:hypothetical protein